MQYLGDYAEDYATLNFKFSTHQADGTPITLAGTPAVSVYKANSTTQSTAGITLTVDFDGVTGLHNVLIDLSADAFYAVGNDYSVVITTGTVNSISVVGTQLAHFSIENRNVKANITKILGTAPTEGGAGRLAAGFTKAYDVATPVWTAASVNQTGDSYARLGSPAGASIAADIAAISATVATAVWGATTRTLSSFGTLAADVWASATRTLSAFAFSVGLTSAYDAAKTAASQTSVDTLAGYVDTEVGSIKAKTDLIPASPAAVGSAMTLTTGERTSIADALLTRDLSAVTGEAARSILNAARAVRNKVVMSNGTVTVYKEDDVTIAWSGTVTTSADADPVTGVDPS